MTRRIDTPGNLRFDGYSLVNFGACAVALERTYFFPRIQFEIRVASGAFPGTHFVSGGGA
jgi:hypothetical protein